jgi:gluconokinase
MIVVVMGVAGSGKTTVGRLLAHTCGYEFLDADTLHPLANVEKMSAGIPLTDGDRLPWLSEVRARIVDADARQQNLVIACSALKEAYRVFLAERVPVVPVYLKGSFDAFLQRLQRRAGHFMKADMLKSQFDTLEEPADAIVVDASRPPKVIVDEIVTRLGKNVPS